MRKVLLALACLLSLPSMALGQSYTITPTPFQTVLDNSGNTVNAGCVWTYSAGTLNAATTYADSAGTPNANPIIADSAGRFTAYLTPGSSYKFVYENVPCSSISHGATLRTADNIGAVPVSGLNVDVTGTAGATLTAGEVVYLNDAGVCASTAGDWYAADSGATCSSSAAGAIGITTAAISASSTGTIRTTGRVTGLTGLTIGKFYYASTGGTLTATPPTNAACIGKADSASSLIVPCDVTDVRLPDSDGTNSVIVRTSSNLTADRLLTIVPGDAARTVTLTGNPTLDQDVSTTGTPSFNVPGTPCGRLTGTTATPVTTADVTGVASIFYTPYMCNTAAVFDGASTWTTLTFSEITISVAACTASKPYDVFLFNNSGTLAAEILVWTNDTTRATALTLQNGVLVKTGATTRRYVGSFYCNSSGGQTDDSAAKRMLFNQYNRAMRAIRVQDNTNSWNYTTATWRQARATTSNQVDLMVGQNEDAIYAAVVGQFSNTNAGVEAAVGIGLDSTTAPTTTGPPSSAFSSVANYYMQSIATYSLTAGVGKHSLVWLEISVATGTTTWGGSRNAFTGTMNSGIFGVVRN